MISNHNIVTLFCANITIYFLLPKFKDVSLSNLLKSQSPTASINSSPF